MQSVSKRPKTPSKQSRRGGGKESKELVNSRQLADNASMLREYRVRLGLSQEQLARETGVSTRTIQRAEAGEPPRNKSVSEVLQGWVREVAFMAQNSIQIKEARERRPRRVSHGSKGGI